MTQQVNLYQASYNWEDDALPSSMILRILGVATAIFMALWLVSAIRTASVTRELSAQTEQLKTLQLKLAEFSERAAHRVADTTLSSRVSGLREQLESKRRLLEALSQRGEGNQDGFSSHLTGLARHRTDNVWLRSIYIAKGGETLRLEGSTLVPEGVPDLIENLSEEESFSGRQFKTFRLEMSDERLGAIDFVLASEAEGTP